MFVGYISKSNCVSSISLPGIYLLRKSLKEMFLLKEQISYEHVPDYIHKLNILYTSLTVKKRVYLVN